MYYVLCIYLSLSLYIYMYIYIMCYVYIYIYIIIIYRYTEYSLIIMLCSSTRSAAAKGGCGGPAPRCRQAGRRRTTSVREQTIRKSTNEHTYIRIMHKTIKHDKSITITIR